MSCSSRASARSWCATPSPKVGCELIKDISVPFVTLVIADLLGVPEADRQVFMDVIAAAPAAGTAWTTTTTRNRSIPLVFNGQVFRELRCRPPGKSAGRYPYLPVGAKISGRYAAKRHGYRAPCHVPVWAPGQDTSAKLLGNCMKFITEQPGLQDQLRANPKSVGAFVRGGFAAGRFHQDDLAPGGTRYEDRRHGYSGGNARADRLVRRKPRSAPLGKPERAGARSATA